MCRRGSADTCTPWLQWMTWRDEAYCYVTVAENDGLFVRRCALCCRVKGDSFCLIPLLTKGDVFHVEESSDECADVPAICCTLGPIWCMDVTVSSFGWA